MDSKVGWRGDLVREPTPPKSRAQSSLSQPNLRCGAWRAIDRLGITSAHATLQQNEKRLDESAPVDTRTTCKTSPLL